MFKKRKSITTVALIILAVMLLVFGFSVFSNQKFLSPPKETTLLSIVEDQSIIEAIKTADNDKEATKGNAKKIEEFLTAEEMRLDNEIIVRRFIENPETFTQDRPVKPTKLDIQDYNVRVAHGERLIKGEIEHIETSFEIVDVNKPLSEQKPMQIKFINDNNYPITIASILNSEAYEIEDKVYVIITEAPPVEERLSAAPATITGYQIYSPPTPFNQVNRSFAILVPYNSANPLPPNTINYLQNKLNTNVVPYFQANLEGTATYNFTIYAVNMSTGWGAENIIATADVFVNYSQYDLALIYRPSFCCGGVAYMQFTPQGSLAYFNTNEPLRAAYAVVDFDPSNLDPQQVTESTTEHEMGHILTAFNPSLNPNIFGGVLPHARGFPGNTSYSCSTNGPVTVCNAAEYGDQLDIMGSGNGLFSHHRATHDLGFRHINSVQSISASGTYTLCSTNHPSSSNCPQEILIQNPNGANLAIELIANPLGAPYSLYQNCQNFFDSLILRVTDLEQGGGFGPIAYLPTGSSISGDVIYPVSNNPTSCTSGGLASIVGYSTFLDFPLHVGQNIVTPLGIIVFQNLTQTATGKQATILIINYSTPNCITAPFTLQLTSPLNSYQFYEQLLYPVSQTGQPQFQIGRISSCAGAEILNVTLQIVAQGTTHIRTTSMTIPNSIQTVNAPFVLPTSMSTVASGTYPFVLTITPTSITTQTILNGTITITSRTPQIQLVTQLDYCSDRDLIPFTPQNLGANYQSPYPNNGASITLVGGPDIDVPDICTQNSNGFSVATDVVCSNNIPGVPPNYGALLYQDCRLVMNNQNAFCFNGVCY